MPALTDGMYKTIFMAGIFFILMAVFNTLFILSAIEEQNIPTDIGSIIGASWNVFAEYPELLMFNALICIVGVVIALIVVREMMPV